MTPSELGSGSGGEDKGDRRIYWARWRAWWANGTGGSRGTVLLSQSLLTLARLERRSPFAARACRAGAVVPPPPWRLRHRPHPQTPWPNSVAPGDPAAKMAQFASCEKHRRTVEPTLEPSCSGPQPRRGPTPPRPSAVVLSQFELTGPVGSASPTGAVGPALRDGPAARRASSGAERRRHTGPRCGRFSQPRDSGHRASAVTRRRVLRGPGPAGAVDGPIVRSCQGRRDFCRRTTG